MKQHGDPNFQPITGVKLKQLDAFHIGDTVGYAKHWLRNTGRSPWDAVCSQRGVVTGFAPPWVLVDWRNGEEPWSIAPTNLTTRVAPMTALARSSLPIIDAAVVEQLTTKTHPNFTRMEQTLVQLAREGDLAGLVTKDPRYSATTIQWHEECQRKFYWPTLAGLGDPPSPAQEEGTELHLHQEHYLKHRKIPGGFNRAQRLALAGHHLLPPPQSSGLRVEENFEIAFDGVPVTVTGQIDFTRDPMNADGTRALDAKSFLLGDHKTKKNKRYPKTKKWLSGNIQSNLYSIVRWIHLLDLGYDALKVVDKRWIYYFKEEVQAEELRVVDSLDHVNEQFETVIKPNLLGMERMVREAPRIGDVPAADKSVCTAYFGCPHYQRCWGMGAKGDSMGAVKIGTFNKANIAGKAAALGAGSAINPPPARPTAVRTPPPEVEAEDAGQGEDTTGQAEIEVQAEDTTPAPTAAAKPAARGRKPKAATQETQASPVEGAARTSVRSQRTPGSNSSHDFWLFVGCRPAYGFSVDPIPIEHIVGAAQANAAEGNEAAHYRDRNSYGALESAFAKWLEENAVTGAVIVDPDTIVARDVVALLRAHASVIVERTM